MGWSPCDACKRRFTGRSAYIYAAIAEHAARVQEKQRLCPSCAEDWLTEVTRFAQLVEDGAPTRSTNNHPTCAICSVELGRRIAFFATSFIGPGQRQDWYAELCPDCSSVLGLAMDWE
jgi:hypothetical protein